MTEQKSIMDYTLRELGESPEGIGEALYFCIDNLSHYTAAVRAHAL